MPEVSVCFADFFVFSAAVTVKPLLCGLMFGSIGVRSVLRHCSFNTSEFLPPFFNVKCETNKLPTLGFFKQMSS